MSNDTQYGLPTPRDKDGQLQPVDHTFDYQGQEVTIRLIPPTVGELDRYEGLGLDVSFADLYDIIDRHLVKPELPGKDDTAGTELACYLNGIMSVGSGGTTEFASDVIEELERRGDGAGN